VLKLSGMHAKELIDGLDQRDCCKHRLYMLRSYQRIQTLQRISCYQFQCSSFRAALCWAACVRVSLEWLHRESSWFTHSSLQAGVDYSHRCAGLLRVAVQLQRLTVAIKSKKWKRCRIGLEVFSCQPSCQRSEVAPQAARTCFCDYSRLRRERSCVLNSVHWSLMPVP
jgi:hypothetical protein